MAGKLVRAYALAYEPSRSTDASLLRSVQRFPADATVSPRHGAVARGRDAAAARHRVRHAPR